MAERYSFEHNFHETPNMYPNLNANISNDQQFGLKKSIKLKIILLTEIRERELISKNLSK